MRVSIHYRGKLADIGHAKLICHDLSQIAEKMDLWNGSYFRG
jgi:hypothetical protein